MRPMFTVHAGEFLVGQHIEGAFKDKNVWVPTKDVGVDLLVTNSANTKAATLQVKFSRDFLPIMRRLALPLQKELRSCTWFSAWTPRACRGSCCWRAMPDRFDSAEGTRYIALRDAFPFH